jgi:hypothetical protein
LVDDPTKQLNVLKRLIIEICKLFVGKHTFLHKIDQVYVNIETRKVTMMIDSKQENALASNFSSGSKESNTFMKFYQNIVEYFFGKVYMINQIDFISIRELLHDDNVDKTNNCI